MLLVVIHPMCSHWEVPTEESSGGPYPPKLTACWGNTDTKQLVPRAEAAPEKGREGGCPHCEYLAA